MQGTSRLLAGVLIGALALIGALISGCGSSSSSSNTPTEMKFGVSESGKTATFSVPKSAEGGLVTLKLVNNGKAPHGLQLIQYTGNHTGKEALEEVASENEKIPDWIKAEGGIGSVEGGKTGEATLNLPGGNYVIVDATALNGEGGQKPATAEMKLSEGTTGELPSTPATVTAEETGKDRYAWKVSGLKVGENEVTFNSEGEKALHMIIAVPVNGKAPPLKEIESDLKKNGPPPAFVDFEDAQATAVIDGGLSQTLNLDLKKPGEYIFFCPMTDRDGGKPHFEEGLLAVEQVH